MTGNNCQFVCNIKTGEMFIAGNEEIPWNSAGTATDWNIIQPFPHHKIIWGEKNGDLMIIPVQLITDMPKFTFGDKLTIAEGKKTRLVTKFFTGEFKPLHYNATVIIEGFKYDVIDMEWSYIVTEVNPGTVIERWEVNEKDVKPF